MKRVCLMVILMSLLFVACEKQQEPKAHIDEEKQPVIEVNKDEEEQVTVKLFNQNKEAVGVVVLTENGQEVKLTLKGENLPPGLHGFHIHEYGLCEEPTFESAGGHFNPDNKKHGFNHDEGPHAGDLPNILVQDDGSIEKVYINDRITLKKDHPHSLRGETGSSLIIHADIDDYISQPAGDAGERIACGVISKKK